MITQTQASLAVMVVLVVFLVGTFWKSIHGKQTQMAGDATPALKSLFGLAAYLGRSDLCG